MIGEPPRQLFSLVRTKKSAKRWTSLEVSLCTNANILGVSHQTNGAEINKHSYVTFTHKWWRIIPKRLKCSHLLKVIYKMYFQPGHSKRNMSSSFTEWCLKEPCTDSTIKSRIHPEGRQRTVGSCQCVSAIHHLQGSALDLPPAQDASQHKDYYIFSREDPDKPSFSTVTGWG